MQKFLALYCAPPEVMEEWRKLSPEEQTKGMDEWVAWGEAHQADIVDFGNPVGGNTRITKDSAAATANEVGGWSIVQAESEAAAIALFADSPHFSAPGGSYIELMPVIDMS